MLKKLFILLLISNMILINNIYCQDANKTIKVTYSIDSKTIRFSPENITVYQGDIIEITANRLVFEGDLINYLDLDWISDYNLMTTKYLFKCIKPGKTLLKAQTTNSSASGKILITILKKSISHNNIAKRIYYKIEDDNILLSKNEIIMKPGDRIILLPKDNNFIDLLIEPDSYDIIEDWYVRYNKHKIYILKAVSRGQSNVALHMAHSYFIKGILKITVE